LITFDRQPYPQNGEPKSSTDSQKPSCNGWRPRCGAMQLTLEILTGRGQ